jgi:hypothetical protein
MGMRRHRSSSCALVALLLAAPPAAAGGARVNRVLPPAGDTAVVLWSQNDDDSGLAVVSQNFESTFDAYDCQAADDFVVPAGETWIVRKVRVTATYFDAIGPADSENVTFYRSEGGAPGRVVRSYPRIVGVDESKGLPSGSFRMTLPEPLKLKPGRYWLSVQVNMDFNSNGEWGWESRNTQVGRQARWVNPGDGFGTGCTTYQPEHDCIPDQAAVDHMFELLGTRHNPNHNPNP